MKPSDELPYRLIEFMVKHTGLKNYPYTGSTRIEQDLGITGDDAVELLDDFGNTFQVQLDSNMYQRIQPEGDMMIAGFINWIRGIPPKEYQDITLGELKTICAGSSVL